MAVNERRVMPRRRVQVPLRFRLVSGRPAPVLTAESLNLCERGVYFLTERPLDVGAQLELFVPVGYDAAAGSATELRCTARVVHCDPRPGARLAAGVGVFIESFEPPAAGP